MSVAIRTITRLQDADDVNVALGVGVDEYALTWDNDTAKFVLRAPFAGLLATGATVGATAQAQAFTNGVVTPYDAPAVDSTTAWQVRKADKTTAVLNVDTTNAALNFYPGGTKSFWIGSNTWSNDERLSLRSLVSGKRTFLDIYPYDADGTDDLGVALFAKGTPTSLNEYEVLEFRYDALNVEFALDSIAGGTGTLRPIDFYASARGQLFLATSGLVGIGTTAPGTLLHAVSTTATTNALRNVLTLGANVTSTGVGAAGLGGAILFTAESTTTVDTQQARIAALWYEATHATFKSDLVGYASDAAGEREIWRGRGNGSAAAIGFLGAAPAARIAHVADPAGGATVDAEARSAINSILATLETFGLHASS